MECEDGSFDNPPETSKSLLNIDESDRNLQKIGCFHTMLNNYEPAYLSKNRMNVPKVKRLRKPTKFRLYEKLEPRFMHRKHKPYYSHYDVSGIYVAQHGFKKREITTIQENEDFVHYNHHRKFRLSRSNWKCPHHKSEEKLEMLIQKFKDGLQSCAFKTTSVQNKMSEDVTQMFSKIKI